MSIDGRARWFRFTRETDQDGDTVNDDPVIVAVNPVDLPNLGSEDQVAAFLKTARPDLPLGSYAVAPIGQNATRRIALTLGALSAAGALGEQVYSQFSGPQTIDASADFTNAVSGAWSVSGAGATISTAGVVSIATTSVLAITTVTVTFTRSDGAIASSSFQVTIEAAAAGDALPQSSFLRGRWNAGTGLQDEIGSNHFAAQSVTPGVGTTTGTTPAGTPTIKIATGARYSAPAAGLPTGAQPCTMFYAGSFDVGPNGLFAGFSYGSPSSGNAFGIARKIRHLGVIGWGNAADILPDQGWSIIPGQFVIATLKRDAAGVTSLKINGHEVAAGTVVYDTLLTSIVLGGVLSNSAVHNNNTTPIEVAECGIYATCLSDTDEQTLITTLTTKHLAGQVYAPLTSSGTAPWTIGETGSNMRPASHFSNGRGAFQMSLGTQNISPLATLSKLVLSAAAGTTGTGLVIDAVDVPGSAASLNVVTDTSAAVIPVANDDVDSVVQGASITLDVLANDVSGGGEEEVLTIFSVSVVAGEELVTGTSIVDNKLVVNMVPDATGTCTINYTTKNTSGYTDAGTVTLTVTAAVTNPPVAPGAGTWDIVPLKDGFGNKLTWTLTGPFTSDAPIQKIHLIDETTGQDWLIPTATPGTGTITARPDQLLNMRLILTSNAGSTISSNIISVRPTYDTVYIETTEVEGVFDYRIPYEVTFTPTVSTTGTAQDKSYATLTASNLRLRPLATSITVTRVDNIVTLDAPVIWFSDSDFEPLTIEKNWYLDGVKLVTNGGPSIDVTNLAPGQLTYRETGTNSAGTWTESSNIITIVGADTIPPSITGVSITPTQTTAALSWSTNEAGAWWFRVDTTARTGTESDISVIKGQTGGTFNTTGTASTTGAQPNISATGLGAGVAYHAHLYQEDAAGNGRWISTSFSTQAAGAVSIGPGATTSGDDGYLIPSAIETDPSSVFVAMVYSRPALGDIDRLIDWDNGNFLVSRADGSIRLSMSDGVTSISAGPTTGTATPPAPGELTAIIGSIYPGSSGQLSGRMCLKAASGAWQSSSTGNYIIGPLKLGGVPLHIFAGPSSPFIGTFHRLIIAPGMTADPFDTAVREAIINADGSLNTNAAAIDAFLGGTPAFDLLGGAQAANDGYNRGTYGSLLTRKVTGTSFTV